MGSVPTNLVMFDPPAFGGPYGLNAPLFDKITAPEYEGLWTPLFGVKSATLEINGKMDSLGVDLYGTNVQDPMNGYIATVAGTAQAGDTPTITFFNPNLPVCGGFHKMCWTPVPKAAIYKNCHFVSLVCKIRFSIYPFGVIFKSHRH